MTEIEPTVENVQPGDVVTLERGTPDEPGHETLAARVTEGREPVAYTCSLGWLRGRAMYEGWKIARIIRPAPPIPTTPIPTTPGERFWAVGDISKGPREFLVTDEGTVVALGWGAQWDLAGFPYYVVPAPEPETVPVPAHLIREAERWHDSPTQSGDVGVGILTRIVWAVREREACDE